jgi:hypothetical protein
VAKIEKLETIVKKYVEGPPPKRRRGTQELGFGFDWKDVNIEACLKEYSEMRTPEIWYSPSGLKCFYKGDCFDRKLDADFFYEHLLRFFKVEPRLYRIAIQLGLIIQNQVTGDTDMFYCSSNTVVHDSVPYIYLFPQNLNVSFKTAKRILQQAERNDFMNRFTHQYARTSADSIALPFYFQIDALLLPFQ